MDIGPSMYEGLWPVRMTSLYGGEFVDFCLGPLYALGGSSPSLRDTILICNVCSKGASCKIHKNSRSESGHGKVLGVLSQ